MFLSPIPTSLMDAMDDFAKSLDVGYRHILASAWPTADRAGFMAW